MKSKQEKREYTGLEMAVLGMSCRFPGAGNIEEFWENLRNGVESISFITVEELAAAGVSEKELEKPNLVRASGSVKDPEFFDAAFFGYKPLEAELLDPQIRLFYECCWEALEFSGYNPDTYEGLIGLYAGATNNRGWEVRALFSEKSKLLGNFARDHLIDRDFLSTRIAYRLNLRGPAVTMKTACSTGLVAVDLAYRGLLTGQCEIALAGASSLMSNAVQGYVYSEGMINSADGHVRAFDARSTGVVFTEGTGVVVLKRLKDALEDRDTILAVIKGTATNNDGSRKGSYEAPCVEGQEEVIRMAMHMGEVEPESVTYVETHGTGTIIGDPIEIEALKRAFNTDKKRFCAIGTVKSNIGHTDTTAGMAGFIKAVLALKHRLIPPGLHYEQPNPRIDFENSPFYVNTGLMGWKNDRYPLRAGVSSFGVGGTNVHVVLEEAPEPAETPKSRDWQMIMISTRTPSALNKAAENLTNYFNENPGLAVADASYTLQTGRKAFKNRQMWVVSNSTPVFDLAQASEARDKNRVVFMFPGQGAQYVNMGKDLYRTEPVFRREMDRGFEILKPLLGLDIKEIIYPSDKSHPSGKSDSSDSSDKSDRIHRTEITQPLLFVFEYALARLIMHWGIKPYAMIGHSIGEYVAACISGVFSVEDALKLVAARGKLMQSMPPGDMMSVTMTEPDLKPLLQLYPELALAAVNAPSLCVVSGPPPPVEHLENQLNAKGIESRRLHTSHAFHSSMMEPILKPLEQAAREISLNKPQLPYISNVTGRWITVEEASSPGYWAAHLRGTVRFRDGLTGLLSEPGTILIEMGPGRSLTTFAQKHPDKKAEHLLVNLVKHPKEDRPDDYYLVNKIGQLWLNGVEIDWKAFYGEEKRRRVPLPTYPFERQLYRFIETTGSSGGELSAERQLPAQTSKSQKKTEIPGWFYLPSWKRSLAVPLPQEPKEPMNWLIFMDNPGKESKAADSIGCRLEERLKQHYPDHRFTRVEIGAAYTEISPGGADGNGQGDPVFAIDPQKESHYQNLVQGLKNQGRLPQRIIHLWNVTGKKTGESGQNWLETLDEYKYRGFYSLIYLARALGREGGSDRVRILVVTDRVQQVTGEEEVCPPKSMILGPVRIIPLENPNLQCSTIDVEWPEAGSRQEAAMLDQLAVECRAETPGPVIALRYPYRWEQGYEPVPPGPFSAPAPACPPILKEGGVYLVTGGLGGIGLELVAGLASGVRAKWVITGRSPFPEPGEWDQWLKTYGPQDKTSIRIRKIREIETGNGTEVMAVSVDTADYRQMQTLIDQVEKRWGKINGVIHAAGVPGGGVIQLKTPEMAEKVLAPKVQGTLVLDRLLGGHPLDFFIFFSSINSVVPVFGQADYFAANAFLDAYAHYKTSVGGPYTVSINWDSWQEVGMAVEAARQWRGRGANRNLQHPLFDRWSHNGDQQAIFVTYFNLQRHWVLNEHKIAESGKGLAPGVTYLEMARQALETYTEKSLVDGSREVEISEVYFLNPLLVGEGEDRETHLILEKSTDQPGGYEFLVQSRGNSGETNWQTHATGKIRWLESNNPPVPTQVPGKMADRVTHLKRELENSSMPLRERKGESREGFLIFGPRWHSIQGVKVEDKEGLAILDLKPDYIDELKFFKLHPALLDSATGFLFGYVGKSAYIPFAYKQLIMRAPMSPKMYSYSRVPEAGETARKESLKFDITIMDEQGRELVEIKEFTMLQVSEEVQGKIREKEKNRLSQPTPRQENDEKKMPGEEILKNGILLSEGKEAFYRILTGAGPVSGALPQVVVSTIDLITRMEQAGQSPSSPAGETGSLPAPVSAAPKHPRPAIGTVYAAPKTELEQKIAEIWQRLLGIEPVGINDDFFELGGDSLNVVQLNNQLKKALNRDIPVAYMFRYQNISAFVKYLQQEETGANVPAVVAEEDRPDDLAQSKERLRARMKKI